VRACVIMQLLARRMSLQILWNWCTSESLCIRDTYENLQDCQRARVLVCTCVRSWVGLREYPSALACMRYHASLTSSHTLNLLSYTLQHAATRCNTLQHTATRCNAMHNTAPHCTTYTPVPIARSFALRLSRARACSRIHTYCRMRCER